MEVFMVKIYLNKEVVFIEHYEDINQAQINANKWEDKGYICEIAVFKRSKIIERDFWREARIEE